MLRDLAKRFGISQQNVTNMLYLTSIAVKDFEVSRLLHKHGYVNDQIAFAEHMLIPEESDKVAWELSKAKPEAEILCLTSYLKLIGYVTPFLTGRVSKRGVDHNLRANLSFLPKRLSTKLLEDTPEIFRQLGLHTTENINKFTGLFVRRIVEPILKDKVKFLP